MAIVIPRLLYNNLVLTPGAAVTASSQEPGIPATFLTDQARGKPWRSLTGWSAVPEFNDELHFLAGSTDAARIGHIVPGNYSSGSAYATAVTAARAAAGNSPKTKSATAWWRADSCTVDSSGRVSQLTDLTGNGRHLTQATAGLRPLYVANAVDSRPGLYFDGTAGMGLSSAALMSTFLGANGIGIVVVVFRLDSDAASNDILWIAGSGTQFAFFQWAGGLNFGANVFDSANRLATKAAVAGVSSWHHGWWVYDQINIQAYVDDADSAAVAATAATGAAHANILGSTFFLGGSAAGPLKGYIVEAWVHNQAVGEAGKRQMVHYVKGRYPSVAANDTTTAYTWTDVVTDTYSSTTKKFTAARTAGAGNVTLYADTTLGGFVAMLNLKDEGFTVANKTGASTYTAENVAYQGRHWVKVDLLTAMAATAGIALDHNAGASLGTFTVEGNADDLWVSPTLTEALSGDAAERSDYWSTQSFRFWRLTIEDVQNTAGYSELGVWFLGTYDTPPAYSVEFLRGYEDLSSLEFGTHGAGYGDERPQRGAWELSWRNISNSEKTALETFQETVPRSKAFFWIFDTPTLTGIRYVHRLEPLSFEHVPAATASVWNVGMRIIEALP